MVAKGTDGRLTPWQSKAAAWVRVPTLSHCEGDGTGEEEEVLVGEVSVGEVSVREVSVGEVSVGEVSGGEAS